MLKLVWNGMPCMCVITGRTSVALCSHLNSEQTEMLRRVSRQKYIKQWWDATVNKYPRTERWVSVCVVYCAADWNTMLYIQSLECSADHKRTNSWNKMFFFLKVYKLVNWQHSKGNTTTTWEDKSSPRKESEHRCQRSATRACKASCFTSLLGHALGISSAVDWLAIVLRLPSPERKAY